MKIAPSILSLDFSKFDDHLKIINDNFEYIHLDIMDGKFVPNTKFGLSTLKQFKSASNLIMDVHLMIVNPEIHIDEYIDAGADIITFHIEALDNDLIKAKNLIDKIHSKNVKAGISIKPNTDIKIISTLLNDLDLVLIMSVEPGFGGQKFMDSSLPKLQYLKQQKLNNSYKYIIEVDGGINNNTAQQCVNAGAELLVIGSYLFNGDLIENIRSIKNI